MSAMSAMSDDGTGMVPATPIMHRLRARGGVIDGFHQSMVLAVPDGLDLNTLTRAVQAVLDRHDLLRARLVRSSGDTTWGLRVDPPDRRV